MQDNNQPQNYEQLNTSASQAPQQQFNQPPQGFNQPPPQQGFNQAQQQYAPPPNMQNPQMVPQNQQPQMPIVNPQQVIQQQIASPLDKLMNMGGIFIKQKVNFIEAFTGCVQQNRYEVFSADMNGEQNSTLPFIQIKEDSPCLQRQCLPSHCRETNLNMVFQIENGVGSGQWIDQLAVKSRKDCSCTCFCLNRPEFQIIQITPNGENTLGTIKNPFYFCHLGVETHKGPKDHHNTAIGSCCQLGVLCPWPCKPCQEVDFQVINSSGQNIVPLKKKSPGCWRACLGPTDYFSVIFPPEYSKEDRLLLIGSALMLDYMYFNDRPDQDQNGGR